MTAPLNFSAPLKWQHDVITVHEVPPDYNRNISFASPTLQRWGPGKENYVLEQAYIGQLFGLVLLTISLSERSAIPVTCISDFNSMQYSLNKDAIAYLKGYGYMPLLAKTSTIQYVAKGSYLTWFEPGVHEFFYLVISNDLMSMLAIEHQHLSELIHRIRNASTEGIMLERMIIDLPAMRLIDNLNDIHLTGTPLNLELIRLITGFLGLYDEQVQAKKENNRPVNAKDLTYLIKAYIGDNITNPSETSYEALAGKFNITQKTIKRNWKKEFGETPYIFIHHMRMNLALYMLISEDVSVNEVANRLQYREAGSFTKEFLKYFKFLPKNARENF